jgi:hypothetical protein
MLGANTFQTEVLGISKHGFWLLLDEKEELFVSFSHFPWFQKARVEQIFEIERPQAHHLYWSDLDIDLDVESIRHPDKFPLVSI